MAVLQLHIRPHPAAAAVGGAQPPPLLDPLAAGGRAGAPGAPGEPLGCRKQTTHS